MGSRSKTIKEKRVRAERRGHFAEYIAGCWFRLSGYRIIARRWRAATGEIDLIVKRQRLLVFVEVKYRFDSEQIAIPTHRVNVKESEQQHLCFSPDIQISLIINAGLLCLLLIMVNSLAWAGSPISKMRGNNAYITLTDESQNATLTHRLLDRP
jgi:hypothetical protein